MLVRLVLLCNTDTGSQPIRSKVSARLKHQHAPIMYSTGARSYIIMSDWLTPHHSIHVRSVTMYKVSIKGTYRYSMFYLRTKSIIDYSKSFVVMHRGLISVGILPPWKRVKFRRENATCGCSIPTCCSFC